MRTFGTENDRKERKLNKRHTEKDTVAPQPTKIASREEQFEGNTVNYLLHFNMKIPQ